MQKHSFYHLSHKEATEECSYLREPWTPKRLKTAALHTKCDLQNCRFTGLSLLGVITLCLPCADIIVLHALASIIFHLLLLLEQVTKLKKEII